ncbi:hypothetical protein ORV05_12485 [Amycolatopsis cynarae]|uniref:WD40 repeat domain-containing protein n=1 Tax=Amycolatopsis cynarae TaxID=2995223 RepID=A0ABY7BBP2_9PSEU|nr:hypothetical protein [Amycolatopsis sp. HUAS 11-8]WAL68548.1 hypothetical protein ORV05_12485 [Amycolatopsis sp. HUAS 11-8]
MTVVEAVTRVPIGDGAPAERLICHPRLPLVAGLDSQRPAVHVWECGAGQLRALGTVGGESDVYADAEGWQRMRATPGVAWHPEQPLLAVASEGKVVRWTPGGLSEVDGLPPAVSYRSLAFGPDGGTLWASPSSTGDWERSDILDLSSGAVGIGPGWDTGIAVHPDGGLAATLRSDQGATLVLFARVDGGTAPAAMRLLRRALILDADGYQTPIFSRDGRHFAIRGNAYENSLEVFEFPSLRRTVKTVLGAPNPYPQEWLDEMRSWSRHNIAFGPDPGVLWVGTPAGTLVEIDLTGRHAAGHDVLAGSRVTGLGATPAGELVVATGEGDLVLLSVLAESATADATADSLRDGVAAFLEATSEVPDDGDPEAHLVLTDGVRTWERDDLATVTTATTEDPTWLRLQAAINTLRDNDK